MAAPTTLTPAENAHLDWLEDQALGILREAAGAFERCALLFSAGKDSCALLRLAQRAFLRERPDGSFEGELPFPLLHIDTGHNFPEVIDFRDQAVAQSGARLLVGSLARSIERGSARLDSPGQSRNAFQSITLSEAIAEHGLHCLIGGARRDEEKSRAKERIFSHRDASGQWRPREQRPELWELFNTRALPGEHLRAFPISDWTEADVWRYIARERIALPSLYYAHPREVARRGGLLVPITPITPALPGEPVERLSARFRTVGDMSCTSPVESQARDAWEVLAETLASPLSERGATRRDDQASDAAMERRKREGYF